MTIRQAPYDIVEGDIVQVMRGHYAGKVGLVIGTGYVGKYMICRIKLSDSIGVSVDIKNVRVVRPNNNN